MSALSYLKTVGVRPSLVGENLKVSGLSILPKDQRAKVIEYAKNHKQEIIEALSQTGLPGQCESCPSAGYWDYAQYAGQGLVCFHDAYYLGRTAKPKSCIGMRAQCPLMSAC